MFNERKSRAWQLQGNTFEPDQSQRFNPHAPTEIYVCTQAAKAPPQSKRSIGYFYDSVLYAPCLLLTDYCLR